MDSKLKRELEVITPLVAVFPRDEGVFNELLDVGVVFGLDLGLQVNLGFEYLASLFDVFHERVAPGETTVDKSPPGPSVENLVKSSEDLLFHVR